jgi:hypothetical protein
MAESHGLESHVQVRSSATATLPSNGGRREISTTRWKEGDFDDEVVERASGHAGFINKGRSRQTGVTDVVLWWRGGTKAGPKDAVD